MYKIFVLSFFYCQLSMCIGERVLPSSTDLNINEKAVFKAFSKEISSMNKISTNDKNHARILEIVDSLEKSSDHDPRLHARIVKSICTQISLVDYVSDKSKELKNSLIFQLLKTKNISLENKVDALSYAYGIKTLEHENYDAFVKRRKDYMDIMLNTYDELEVYLAGKVKMALPQNNLVPVVKDTDNYNGEFLVAGMSPDGISNRAIRERYIKAIKDNREYSERYLTISRLNHKKLKLQKVLRNFFLESYK